MTVAAIELDHLHKRHGDFVLGPLTLDVPRGVVSALIGPNGAGKTTTLDLLMGMGQADGGQIRILGRDLADHEVEIKRRTAYVGPEVSYQAWGTVGRAIDFVSGFYPDWDVARCERLVQEFELKRGEKVSALSFGAKIKLALVMALAREAELMLLDEPTTGLDVGSRRELFAELLAFMKREDRTILISSHQLTDLERFADHYIIIDKGRLIAQGPMDALVDRYQQLDARLQREPPRLEGLRLLERQGDRARFLLDREVAGRLDLAAEGIEVIGEVPLTLEELYLALVQK